MRTTSTLLTFHLTGRLTVPGVDTNPYTGYDDIHSGPFLFHGEVDVRLPPKARLVGVRDGDAAVAILLDNLRVHHVVATELAGRPLVVWERDGTASPLDTAEVADGRDVGATGVFDAKLDGRVLHSPPWAAPSATLRRRARGTCSATARRDRAEPLPDPRGARRHLLVRVGRLPTGDADRQ